MYISKVALALTFFSFAQGQDPRPDRETPFEKVNYNDFIGNWHSCLETSHMTFEGVAQKKHTHQNVPCRGVHMANITYVGDEDGMDHSGFEKVTQILQLQRIGLNHCEMWGLTGATCPNATMPGNERTDEQTVMYKQNFHGIGSYLNEHRVKFYGEEKSITTVDGSTVRGKNDHIEDQDFFDCSYNAKLEGLLCDRRQNEFRNGDGVEGSEWRPIAYNDFGTHYLVKDMAQCQFCDTYKCVDYRRSVVANILGLGASKTVTCANVGKIQDEVIKMAVCDTKAKTRPVKGTPIRHDLIKGFCPNVCGACMD